MNENDRSIVGLVTVAHGMVHTYELSIPIFLTVWLAEFGATEATMGIVVSIGYGLFGLGALPAGVLVDALGSQRLIAACLAGMAGSFVVLAAAPTVAVIGVALLLWGAAASVYHPAGLSLISTGVTERGRAFAYHGMAGNLGIALGPLATAILLLVLDWRAVAVALAAPALVAAAFALTTDVDPTSAVDAAEPTADGGKAVKGGVSSAQEFVASSRLLFTGGFVVVFGIVVLSGLFYRGVLTFLPEIISEFPTFEPVTVGTRELEPSQYFFAGLLLVGVFGQYVGGRLTDRVPTEYGLAAGFATLAVLAVVFLPAASAGLAPFLAVSAALGFALFAVQPMYQATVAEYTPADLRGLSYGYTYLAVFGIGASGGAVAGIILTYAGPRELFLVLAGFGTLAAAFGVLLSHSRGTVPT